MTAALYNSLEFVVSHGKITVSGCEPLPAFSKSIHTRLYLSKEDQKSIFVLKIII